MKCPGCGEMINGKSAMPAHMKEKHPGQSYNERMGQVIDVSGCVVVGVSDRTLGYDVGAMGFANQTGMKEQS